MKIAISKTNSLKITQKSDKITVHGRPFEIHTDTEVDKAIEDVNKELENLITNICWFSYRRGFTPMSFDIGNKKILLTCDTGWGCMLRSGQMMLFQV